MAPSTALSNTIKVENRRGDVPVTNSMISPRPVTELVNSYIYVLVDKPE